MPNFDRIKTEANEIIKELNAVNNQCVLTEKTKSVIHQMLLVIDSCTEIIDAKNETIAAKEDIIVEQNNHITLLNQTQRLTQQIVDAPKLREHNRSIVIKNLPESLKTTVAEVTKEDQEKVEKLINDVGAYSQVAACYRMGKKVDQNGKPRIRLMKVQLQTSSQARELIMNAKNLKGNQNYQKVVIRKSMTASELAEESKKIEQLQNRINELKILNPQMQYVIYAGKICEKQLDGSKPVPVKNETLNINFTGGNSEPMDASKF
uniref:Uncharacterized protein n=1 Tax=Panagrolaimus sp. PS1159 TaxID=55785 RepID=A0AC35GIX2_9BILA